MLNSILCYAQSAGASHHKKFAQLETGRSWVYCSRTHEERRECSKDCVAVSNRSGEAVLRATLSRRAAIALAQPGVHEATAALTVLPVLCRLRLCLRSRA
jgi:hypothetical protein